MMYKNKKLIAFDLDDTLAITKTPISESIAVLLIKLLKKYDVCVISGGSFAQMKIQVIDRLKIDGDHLRLHLMPTCGTQYYLFDNVNNNWKLQYKNDLSDDQKARIFEVIKTSVKKLGFWTDNLYGEVIEDRGSQVTFAALGQDAPADLKYEWDPDGTKRHKICESIIPLLSDFEVRIAGTTSIDVTIKGVDKSYGMSKLIENTGYKKTDILYFGDKLQIGGNDYPVKAMGIDCVEVEKWQDTAEKIKKLL